MRFMKCQNFFHSFVKCWEKDSEHISNSVNPHQITVLLYFFVNLKFMFLIHVYVVLQFYPWFKFYFLLFLGIIMYDNEFETKKNRNLTTTCIRLPIFPSSKYSIAR